jgi:predicted PilT family ATPase
MSRLILNCSRPYGSTFYFKQAIQATYIKKALSSKNCSIVVTRYLNIETRSIGLIIGRGGTTIKKIVEKCNVKIIIPAREERKNQSTVIKTRRKT